MTTTSPPVDFEQDFDDEFDEQPKKASRSPIAIIIAAVVAIVVVTLIVFFATRGDDGSAEREATRSKAEAVLKARFNDTSVSVGPLQTISVTWQGDQLVATWVQGENAQKRCTAPVLVSPDGQNFGIEPFGAVPFDKQGTAKATCTITAGLEYGFPMG